MLVVSYRGRRVASVDGSEVTLTPAIAVLESGHPLKRWVVCLAMFAGYVIDGQIEGGFSEARACHFARLALIPTAEFAPIRNGPDHVLAERFNVPLEQIAEKREDVDLYRRIGRTLPRTD